MILYARRIHTLKSKSSLVHIALKCLSLLFLSSFFFVGQSVIFKKQNGQYKRHNGDQQKNMREKREKRICVCKCNSKEEI